MMIRGKIGPKQYTQVRIMRRRAELMAARKNKIIPGLTGNFNHIVNINFYAVRMTLGPRGRDNGKKCWRIAATKLFLQHGT